jgi:hypothetical protein
MCVVGAVCVCVSFEDDVSSGYGSLRIWGMRLYGQVKWPIDTFKPVVYVVSGGRPSATWLARVSARSLPIEW